MTEPDEHHVDQIAARAQAGEAEARSSLFDQLYDELKIIARARMKNERADHTLQPTALVNEAYLRLADQRNIDWDNPGQVLGLAAITMRRVLVDHARGKGRQRRGGDRVRVEVDPDLISSGDEAPDILALDEALTKLEAISPRQARVVELRSFASLSVERISEVLGVSKRTIESDWAAARGWLADQLRET